MIDKFEHMEIVDNILSLFIAASVIGFIAVWGIYGFFYALGFCAGCVALRMISLICVLWRRSI